MPNPAEVNCIKLAEDVSGTYRVSRRGVPHIFKKIGDITYSACFFINGGFWRIFYPYDQFGESKQTKITMKSTDEVKKFFEKKESEVQNGVQRE
jgi:hypothetical protein